MKKIGKRTIKTAIAVGLALLVKLLLMICIDVPTGTPWSKIIYTPFFGAIAAAYSMHANMNASKNQAKIRTMGSIVGGLYGMVILIICNALFAHAFQIPQESPWFYVLDYAIVAVAIIPMIHLTVVTKKTYATWIACLTYLSVTVSIRNDFDDQLFGMFSQNAIVNSYIIAIVFAFNRILSTIIGVGISLAVNLFKIPRKTKNKDILFCVGVEGIVSGDKDNIAGFMNYELNRMSDEGANLALFTTRVPRTFMHFFGNIQVNNPIVCMSGAALYDPKTYTYLDKEEIPYDVCQKLDKLIDEIGSSPFKNYIVNNMLYVFNERLDNIGEEIMAKEVSNGGYGNFILGKCPGEINSVFYMLIEKADKANMLKEMIANSDIKDEVIVQVYDVFDNNSKLVEGYLYVKIYSINVLKLRVLHDYAKGKGFRIAGLTTHPLSNHLLENSEIKVTSTEASSDAIVIKNYEDMVKQVSYIYHNKKYSLESQVKNNE